jgi:hypothetical protein
MTNTSEKGGEENSPVLVSFTLPSILNPLPLDSTVEESKGTKRGSACLLNDHIARYCTAHLWYSILEEQHPDLTPSGLGLEGTKPYQLYTLFRDFSYGRVSVFYPVRTSLRAYKWPRMSNTRSAQEAWSS